MLVGDYLLPQAPPPQIPQSLPLLLYPEGHGLLCSDWSAPVPFWWLYILNITFGIRFSCVQQRKGGGGHFNKIVYFSTQKTTEIGSPGAFWWLQSHPTPRLLSCSIILRTLSICKIGSHSKEDSRAEPSHHRSIPAEAKTYMPRDSPPSWIRPLKQPF